MTDAAPRRERMLRGWPAIVGVLFAAGLVLLLRIGLADSVTAAEVLTAAAFVYLGAAALGRRAAAWPLFGLTFVLIGAGIALKGFSPSWAMIVLGAVLLGYGLFRGRLQPGWGIPAQTLALLVVLGIALLVPLLPAPWGSILVGVGLLAHAAWDLRHLRTRRVVAPTMAEFCAALDTVLAVGVIAVAL
ncbi:hypothetical protein [Microbacterium tumbae]